MHVWVIEELAPHGRRPNLSWEWEAIDGSVRKWTVRAEVARLLRTGYPRQLRIRKYVPA